MDRGVAPTAACVALLGEIRRNRAAQVERILDLDSGTFFSVRARSRGLGPKTFSFVSRKVVSLVKLNPPKAAKIFPASARHIF
jgi:hypothetical protein